ncbi:MAG: hypothetical protein QXH37_08625 [Candidatus Bathyarchaeia archaeon]
MIIESQLKVKIPRNVKVATYPFTKFFKGFENVEVVRRIFGENTEKILSSLQVEFAGFRGYMGVSDVDGHLIISAHYLNNGNLIDIYLDIIHELVHVKQFMDGKKLFDDRYSYVGRPTEIEAYRYAVEEAKRLGLNDARICQYLKTEWISEKELKKLAKALDVEYVPSAER